MADIVVVKAKVSPVNPSSCDIKDYIAGVALTAGQPVYVDAAGKAQIADANGSSPINRFRGIALNDAGIGQAVSVLRYGEVAGFTLTSQAYDAPIYVSDTAGSLADAAGSTSLLVGVVSVMSDKDLTKVLFVNGISG